MGVDVGSAASIRNELIALRAAGCAIVIVSEELDELYQLADRLMVMSGGRLSRSKAPHELSVGELGRWMAGSGRPKIIGPRTRSTPREFVEACAARDGIACGSGYRRSSRLC